MKNLAIIPARGGSKRIPKKNIRDFLGKPIIAYSIQTALESKLFDEVMVSTDDDEIVEIAKSYGAGIPFIRSAENADDYATLADVVDEVKNEYLNRNRKFRNTCCILPTAPLITIENLKKGLDLLLEKKVDSVRPIVRFSYPIQRAIKLVDGKTEMFYPQFKAMRSQDLEPAYHDAGQFYWMKFETGLRGQNKYGFELSEMQVQDIDSYEEWKIAEMKYKLQYGKK